MHKTLIRIVTGMILIGLLVLCLHLGDIVFLLIFGAFFLITVREMDNLIKAMGKEIVSTPASIFAGFFGIVYYLTSYNLSVVFAFGLLMVAATIMGQVMLMKDDFSAAAYCLLPFVYPILSECALVAIYFALPSWMAKTACCAAILCPSMGDSAAYFGGMALGKRGRCSALSAPPSWGWASTTPRGFGQRDRAWASSPCCLWGSSAAWRASLGICSPAASSAAQT